MTYAYGPDSKFDLPSDDYVLATVAVVEQPFSVKAGEQQDEYRHEPRVLAVRPGSKIEIFEAKQDIIAKRSRRLPMTRSTRRRYWPATMRSSRSRTTARRRHCHGQGRRAR